MAILGAAGAALYLVKRYQIGAASFNPLSDQNLAYRASNAVTQWITGDPNQTTGGALFDAINPGAGLGRNEYSPAPGLIVTRVGVISAEDYAANLDAEDSWMGALSLSQSNNPAGALTGRTVPRGF